MVPKLPVKRYQRVAMEGVTSDWLPVSSGVPQGSILGSFLFVLFANDLPHYIQAGSSLALFADDSTLHRTLDSPDSSTSLQHDLDRLRVWSLDNSMTFNPSKCKALRISRKKSPTPTFPYKLDGHLLEYVTNMKDLGVTVSCQLQWTSHIEEVTAKVSKTLGLVNRICRDVHDVRTRRLLYCSLVIPQLKYCSSLWSPYTVKHRALVEIVQRRTTKFILNFPPSHVSYTDRLTKLNLLPLEYRRSIKDIILFYKFKSGIMPIECDKFFISKTVTHKTRNSNLNNFITCEKHHQNCFRFSYFPRTVNFNMEQSTP